MKNLHLNELLLSAPLLMPHSQKIHVPTTGRQTTIPQSFNDLIPIAINPLPSLICEDFVFDWAYSDIKTYIDSQQFGDMKSFSTTHCNLSFLDFMHSHLNKRNIYLTFAFVD